MAPVKTRRTNEDACLLPARVRRQACFVVLHEALTHILEGQRSIPPFASRGVRLWGSLPNATCARIRRALSRAWARPTTQTSPSVNRLTLPPEIVANPEGPALPGDTRRTQPASTLVGVVGPLAIGGAQRPHVPSVRYCNRHEPPPFDDMIAEREVKPGTSQGSHSLERHGPWRNTALIMASLFSELSASM
jgi:hypothetical protein